MTNNSQIAGPTEEERKIWFTYHSNALIATREAIKQDRTIKCRVRPKRTDKRLVCMTDNLGNKFQNLLQRLF